MFTDLPKMIRKSYFFQTISDKNIYTTKEILGPQYIIFFDNLAWSKSKSKAID